jgi:hypothetical protein
VTAVPVRTPSGPLHLCKATGRGYRTACGRTLAGASLVVPRRRDWRRAWSLELVCARCEAKRIKARTDSELARLAGW